MYQSGVEAYRAAVKWLVGLVPAATIVAGGIAVGPDLVDAATRLTWDAFLDAHWPALVGIALVAGGFGVIAWRTASVLAEQAPNVNELDATTKAEAFQAGVLLPFFVDEDVYDEFGTLLTAWVDAHREGGDSTPPAPDAEIVKALGGATESLRAWALHRQLKAKFSKYVLWFGGGVVAMIAGFLLAAVDLDTDRRDPPVAVTVSLNAAAWDELELALGCDVTPDENGVRPEIAVWLVAGDWRSPLLQVDGAGCVVGRDWTPSTAVGARPVQS